MKITSKSNLLFLIATLLLAGFIAYFGFRTVEHEALLRHYQTQTIAQSRTTQIYHSIVDLLNQKAVRIQSMSDFMQFDEVTLRELTEKDSDIDAVFILQKNQLIFPNELKPLSDKEQRWIQTITPIIHDPSLLYSHAFVSEHSLPQAGWFITNETNEPVFLYWLQKNGQTIGFKLSYIKLISDLINGLNIDFTPDILLVKDNDKVLYQSNGMVELNEKQLTDTKRLPYPLTNWQIDYYAAKANNSLVYLWGGILMVLLIMAMGLIMYRIYREYTQSARLARQQVNFVSQVSHELKTPLTNITLYAEMLREEQAEFEPESHITRYLDVITSESQRLSRLIQNILTFTKASKVHIKSVNVSCLVSKIAQTFIPAFDAKGIVLQTDISPDLIIESDEDRITQIISNFLSNAQKYAAQGKRVDLRVSHNEAKSSVEIGVRDYGEGIALKELKAIFQPFYRVKSDITEGVSGTGIGLTIAEQLAENLGGVITVESRSPGVQFSLILPYFAKDR